MSLKHEFVALALREGANVRELCRRYGVSPPTAYQLLDRYAQEGEAGLAKRSRRPHHSPNQTPVELELAVLRVREEHPTWGGRTIRRVLHNSGYGYLPSPSTITAILRRNNRLATGERAPHHWQRFEHAQPNDLWQMDFKGHFPTGAGRCLDRPGRSLPLRLGPAGMRQRAHRDGAGTPERYLPRLRPA